MTFFYPFFSLFPLPSSSPLFFLFIEKRTKLQDSKEGREGRAGGREEGRGGRERQGKADDARCDTMIE